MKFNFSPLLACLFISCGGTSLNQGAGIIQPVSASSANTSANPSASPVPAALNRAIGMNFSFPMDWAIGQPYANILKTARDFYDSSHTTQIPVSSLDANLWPQSDFSFIAWAGINHMDGTYAISFPGQATISVWGLTATLSNAIYDSSTNSTTAKLNVADTGTSTCYLSFTQTKKTQISAPGSGLINLKIMRPVSPGSSQSFAATELLNTPLRTVMSQVQTVRYMDLTATNWNQQINWSDRAVPAEPSVNRFPNNQYGWEGLGAPWEDVVLIANELNRDAWINIPAMATDDYILKVAQLFAFGSDGVNPYTGSYGSTYDATLNPRPAPNAASSWSPGTTFWYPPLRSTLNLYIEYSNEVWNSEFSQSSYNYSQAQTEVSAGNSPLNFDGETNTYYFAWRRIANRAVQISNIFRYVNGDSAMPGTASDPRVRPILMTQEGNGQNTVVEDLYLMMSFYNNLTGNYVGPTGSYPALLQWPSAPGALTVSGAHPPSYYFYGAGGAAYYNPDNSDANLSLNSSDSDYVWSSQTMNVSTWNTALVADIDPVKMMGLHRIAYEGGASMDHTGNAESVKAQAWSDPQMTTAMLQHQAVWEQNGGDLLVYYTAAGDYQWGFFSDLTQLSTPKLNALSQIYLSSPASANYGHAQSIALDGANYDFGSNNCWYPSAHSAGAMGLQAASPNNACNWVNYSFLVNASAARGVDLVISSAAGSVSVYVDGVLLGTQAAANGIIHFASANSLPAGIHGVTISATTGTFSVDSVTLN